jgi:hypothetical protein
VLLRVTSTFLFGKWFRSIARGLSPTDLVHRADGWSPHHAFECRGIGSALVYQCPHIWQARRDLSALVALVAHLSIYFKIGVPRSPLVVSLPICFLQAEITLLRLMSDLINRQVGTQLSRNRQKLKVPNDEDHQHTKLNICQFTS